MSITLRKVVSMEDVDYNFAALANALANITGDQIVGGSIGAGQVSGEFMPRGGGSFTGNISAPNVTATTKVTTGEVEASGKIAGASLEVTGLAKAGGKALVPDDQAATVAAMGLVLKAAAVANMATAISNPPTQAQVTELRDKLNTLLTNMRTAGSLET